MADNSGSGAGAGAGAGTGAGAGAGAGAAGAKGTAPAKEVPVDTLEEDDDFREFETDGTCGEPWLGARGRRHCVRWKIRLRGPAVCAGLLVVGLRPPRLDRDCAAAALLRRLGAGTRRRPGRHGVAG